MRARNVLNEIRRGSMSSLSMGSARHAKFWTVMNDTYESFAKSIKPIEKFEPFRVSKKDFMGLMRGSIVSGEISDLWFIRGSVLDNAISKERSSKYMSGERIPHADEVIDQFVSLHTAKLEELGTLGSGETLTEWNLLWDDTTGFGQLEELFDPSDSGNMTTAAYTYVFRRPTAVNEIRREANALRTTGSGSFAVARFWNENKERFPHIEDVMVPFEEAFKHHDRMEWQIFLERAYSTCDFSKGEVMAVGTKIYQQHLLRLQMDGKMSVEPPSEDIIADLRDISKINTVPKVITNFPLNVEDKDSTDSVEMRWDDRRNMGYVQVYYNASFFSKILIKVK